MFSNFTHYAIIRYRGRNSTTAEEVSRFKCVFPNPNWLVWKGINRAPIPGDFSASGQVKSSKVLPEVWLSTQG